MKKHRTPEERMKIYPRDRIAFIKYGGAPDDDKAAFHAYVEGRMNLDDLCKIVAKNNQLPYVTHEQMINELVITCWLK